jgi:glutamyl-tRNA reductase
MSTEISKLTVIGISHKTSSVSERERFQINKKEIRKALNYFKEIKDVEGIVIISTCNRLEFYMVSKPDVDSSLLINDFYCKNGISDFKIHQDQFYLYKGIDAAEHLFNVASSLDSMLLGEYQIQNQVKDAYSLACSEKTTEKILHKLFHAAFRAGKAVRTKTKIGSCNQSLSGVAFKIINERIKKEDVVTIIGVNQNTKIIAEKLYKAGYIHLIFVNRTLHKAEELADKYNGIAFSLDCIEEPMISSKCIFSCTGAPGFIITPDIINKVHQKANLPKLFIDMAVPRDIDTRGLRYKIELIDFEALKKYLENQKEEISSILPEAKKIISEETSTFEAWSEYQTDEIINQLNEKIERARIELLNDLELQYSAEEFELLDKFSRTFLHRIKPIIISEIKASNTHLEINLET